MFKTTIAVSTLLALTALSTESPAHTPTRQECSEAGAFVKNAAISRDNGMDGVTFTAKLLADFEVIRSFPQELRWFVHDREDEDLLLRAIASVFQNPTRPEVHEQNFLEECAALTSVRG